MKTNDIPITEHEAETLVSEIRKELRDEHFDAKQAVRRAQKELKEAEDAIEACEDRISDLDVGVQVGAKRYPRVCLQAALKLFTACNSGYEVGSALATASMAGTIVSAIKHFTKKDAVSTLQHDGTFKITVSGGAE